MELPKNITQVGEANHRCKIYVEDYAVSYMKQLNVLARDKDMAVALYGVRKEESDVAYLFVYGAVKLNFLQRETRHLSQAQLQEIEKNREKYFREQEFLGYRLLNGEMIEGFHVCEQGICRYIEGYAQFYEKNDSMLAYMLDVREEKAPEVVSQEKYEEVKKRQEERREQYSEQSSRRTATVKAAISNPQENKSASDTGNVKMMRYGIVAAFALLCYVGLQSVGEEGGWENLQAKAKQALDSVMEQQIPDAMAEDTLVAEDKLADAILQENALPVQGPATVDPEVIAETVEQLQSEGEAVTPQVQPAEQVAEPVVAETAPAESTQTEQATIQTESVTEEVPAAAQPTYYVIKEGDTLIGISVLNYGTDSRVAEICTLNQINNPDDIKVGQKILLP